MAGRGQAPCKMPGGCCWWLDPRETVDDWSPRETIDDWNPREPIDDWNPREPIDDWNPRQTIDDWNPREPIDQCERKGMTHILRTTSISLPDCSRFSDPPISFVPWGFC